MQCELFAVRQNELRLNQIKHHSADMLHICDWDDRIMFMCDDI